MNGVYIKNNGNLPGRIGFWNVGKQEIDYKIVEPACIFHEHVREETPPFIVPGPGCVPSALPRKRSEIRLCGTTDGQAKKNHIIYRCSCWYATLDLSCDWSR